MAFAARRWLPWRALERRWLLNRPLLWRMRLPVLAAVVLALSLLAWVWALAPSIDLLALPSSGLPMGGEWFTFACLMGAIVGVTLPETLYPAGERPLPVVIRVAVIQLLVAMALLLPAALYEGLVMSRTGALLSPGVAARLTPPLQAAQAVCGDAALPAMRRHAAVMADDLRHHLGLLISVELVEGIAGLQQGECEPGQSRVVFLLTAADASKHVPDRAALARGLALVANAQAQAPASGRLPPWATAASKAWLRDLPYAGGFVLLLALVALWRYPAGRAGGRAAWAALPGWRGLGRGAPLWRITARATPYGGAAGAAFSLGWPPLWAWVACTALGLWMAQLRPSATQLLLSSALVALALAPVLVQVSRRRPLPAHVAGGCIWWPLMVALTLSAALLVLLALGPLALAHLWWPPPAAPLSEQAKAIADVVAATAGAPSPLPAGRAELTELHAIALYLVVPATAVVVVALIAHVAPGWGALFAGIAGPAAVALVAAANPVPALGQNTVAWLVWLLLGAPAARALLRRRTLDSPFLRGVAVGQVASLPLMFLLTLAGGPARSLPDELPAFVSLAAMALAPAVLLGLACGPSLTGLLRGRDVPR